MFVLEVLIVYTSTAVCNLKVHVYFCVFNVILGVLHLQPLIVCVHVTTCVCVHTCVCVCVFLFSFFIKLFYFTAG